MTSLRRHLSAAISVSVPVHNEWSNGLPPTLTDNLLWVRLYHMVTTLECESASQACDVSWQRRKPHLLHKNSSRSCWETALTESLSHSVTSDPSKRQLSYSHEAQLGLAAHQDLPQALDTSHLHLDLLWIHSALSHGHIWMTCEGVTGGVNTNTEQQIKAWREDAN